MEESTTLNRTRAKLSSLVELLRWRACEQPQHEIYAYLIDGETEGGHLTYEGLEAQARTIGALPPKLSGQG